MWHSRSEPEHGSLSSFRFSFDHSSSFKRAVVPAVCVSHSADPFRIAFDHAYDYTRIARPQSRAKLPAVVIDYEVLVVPIYLYSGLLDRVPIWLLHERR
jgi:hypothetical protein